VCSYDTRTGALRVAYLVVLYFPCPFTTPPQTERNDLLETVRQLTRTLKLKELIIANFIPEESARLLERRAAWVENEEGDGWVMPVSGLCSAVWLCG
jgi:hypothetical protein